MREVRMLDAHDYESLHNAGLGKKQILADIDAARAPYRTEGGKKRLLAMLRHAGMFEQIPAEDALTLGARNHMIYELEEMGLLNEGILLEALKVALSLVPSLPWKEEGEEEK